jgi:hypothetical protein
LARQLPELPEADGSSADKKAANKSLQKALTKQTSSPVSIQKAVTKPTAPVSVTAPISLSKSITG